MDILKRRTGVVIWTLVCCTLFLSIVYMILRLWSAHAVLFTIPEQLVGLLDQTAATLVGVIVGIPVALWLSRRQEENEDRRASEKQTRIRRERYLRVLTHLREELQYNVDGLQAMIERHNSDPTARLTFGYKLSTWKAMSAGGELQWIDSPDILNHLSEAYFYLEPNILAEERLIGPFFGTSDKDNKAEEAQQMRIRTLAEVQTVLRAVDKELACLTMDVTTETVDAITSAGSIT